MKHTLREAVDILSDNAECVIINNITSYEIIWLDENKKQPTKIAIDKKVKELDAIL